MKNNYSIQLLKKLSITTIILSMVSCSFFTNPSEAQNTEEGYVVQPNYDHPKFKALDAAFAKQEHRFEIDRCEFKYNDKAFFIGDSEEKIISALGEPDERFAKPSSKKYNFEYLKLKLQLWFTKENNQLASFSIQMSDHRGHEDTPYQIIKFRKVPYQLDMTLNEFTKLCDLRHNETLGHTSYTFYIQNEKKCDLNTLKTTIGSTAYYDTNDLGGHMTTRGGFDSNTTGPIRSLYMGLVKKQNN